MTTKTFKIVRSQAAFKAHLTRRQNALKAAKAPARKAEIAEAAKAQAARLASFQRQHAKTLNAS